jgi:hypothetical protein
VSGTKCGCGMCKTQADGLEASRKVLNSLALTVTALRGQQALVERGEPLEFHNLPQAFEAMVDSLETATAHFTALEDLGE